MVRLVPWHVGLSVFPCTFRSVASLVQLRREAKGKDLSSLTGSDARQAGCDVTRRNVVRSGVLCSLFPMGQRHRIKIRPHMSPHNTFFLHPLCVPELPSNYHLIRVEKVKGTLGLSFAGFWNFYINCYNLWFFCCVFYIIKIERIQHFNTIGPSVSEISIFTFERH